MGRIAEGWNLAWYYVDVCDQVTWPTQGFVAQECLRTAASEHSYRLPSQLTRDAAMLTSSPVSSPSSSHQLAHLRESPQKPSAAASCWSLY